jgi:hypothetical protein
MTSRQAKMTEKNQSNAIEGFFLSFTPEDMEDVRRALESNGYTPDGEGMKEILLDVLFSDSVSEKPRASLSEEFVEKAKRYVVENPEKVKKGIDFAIGLVKMVRGGGKPAR